MSELKRCPFCGGKPEVERMGTGRQSMIITCTNCGATCECSATFLEAAAWNDREPDHQAEREKLREALAKIASHASGVPYDMRDLELIAIASEALEES